MDAIVWSNRGKWGEKLTVGAIDERSMYGIHTELSCKTTEETAEAFVTMVKQLREDPVFGRPDLFTRVNLDSAGEWGPFNAEFHRIVRKELDSSVQFIYPPTMIDSRFNAHAEVFMRMIEEMTKAIMMTTRLETELRPLATAHAVFVHNRTVKRSRAGPDGCGLRPLQEISGYRVSAEECERQLEKAAKPGELFLVRRQA